jgi:hypothetical protein
LRRGEDPDSEEERDGEEHDNTHAQGKSSYEGHEVSGTSRVAIQLLHQQQAQVP